MGPKRPPAAGSPRAARVRVDGGVIIDLGLYLVRIEAQNRPRPAVLGEIMPSKLVPDDAPLTLLDVSDFAIGRKVDPEVLAHLCQDGILNHVERAPDGTLLRSVAVLLVEAPLDRVVEEVRRIRTHEGGFLRDVNLIHRVTVLPGPPGVLRLRLALRYRFLLFRTTFEVDADVTLGEGASLDLVGVAGKPSGLRAHFRALAVSSEGRPATLVFCSLRFDIASLGWLVDYFLKHHPEIELGVFSATAPVIVLTLKEAVEGKAGMGKGGKGKGGKGKGGDV